MAAPSVESLPAVRSNTTCLSRPVNQSCKDTHTLAHLRLARHTASRPYQALMHNSQQAKVLVAQDNIMLAQRLLKLLSQQLRLLAVHSIEAFLFSPTFCLLRGKTPVTITTCGSCETRDAPNTYLIVPAITSSLAHLELTTPSWP